jgi:hypothetical protein
MVFHKGQMVRVLHRSDDESWEEYMDGLVGSRGIVTDPDSQINDPDSLIEVSLEDRGTYRLPQDCLEVLDQAEKK